MPKFTRIKGEDKPQNIIRLPRLGKLRLGIKKKSSKGTEYPAECDFFVCPPEVQAKFGDKPKTLPVMIPVENEEMFMRQYYAVYGSNQKLKCQGNGEVAERRDEKGKKFEVACPSPDSCDFAKQHGCKARIDLMVVLPDVNCGGVYQLSSGSINTDIDIRSGIEMAKGLFGRISWTPLMLTREEKKIPDPATGKMQTHWPVSLYPQANVAEVNQIRSDSKRILDRQERFALPEPAIEGEFTPEETEREIEEEKPKEESQTKAQKKTDENGNQEGKKERFLAEIRGMADMQEIVDFQNSINEKIKGFKATDALEISRELNNRRAEIQKAKV